MDNGYDIVVIYLAFCLDVAQGPMNGALSETRTHSCWFAYLTCKTLLHPRCPWRVLYIYIYIYIYDGCPVGFERYHLLYLMSFFKQWSFFVASSFLSCSFLHSPIYSFVVKNKHENSFCARVPLFNVNGCRKHELALLILMEFTTSSFTHPWVQLLRAKLLLSNS